MYKSKTETNGNHGKIPETYAEYFVRKYQARINNSSIEAILDEFCIFMRPAPGRYTYSPQQYVFEFKALYQKEIDTVGLPVLLEGFTLFISHCSKFAVDWVFYSHVRGL